MWAFDIEAQKWEQLPAIGSPPSKPDCLPKTRIIACFSCLLAWSGRAAIERTVQQPIRRGRCRSSWACEAEPRPPPPAPTGPQPPPRFLYGMDAYTAPDGDARLAIFGGESAKQEYLNDAWEWSVGSGRWRQLSAGAADRRRAGG